MPKQERKKRQLVDPYRYLSIQVISFALREIRAYYFQTGTEEEIRSGCQWERWIRKMDRSFQTIASVWNYMHVESFHARCIHKINLIREEAYEHQKTQTNGDTESIQVQSTN